MLDSHESHRSAGFENHRKESDIIMLCTSPYSSHALQSLNIRCFSALKRLYGRKTEKLMRNHTHHTESDFFLAFQAVF